MKKKTMILAFSTVLGVSLLGTAGYKASAAYEQAKISKEEAVKIVEKEYKGDNVDVNFEYDDGKPEYEVKFNEGEERFEVEIDAETGKVLKKERKDYDDDSANEKPPHTKITMDKAAEIALNEVAGDIKEAELDHDNGKWVYELEIQTKDGEVNIDIDAMTGKILEIDHDDD
ncbi:hypothetical protein DCC39_11560 [Pueribacillus theae]|uniref:PepSY domain-containing protein n=1 Tax=Pueribacillus theae TaxID=2171751 RepID=A0A2U1JZC7_9BACI|nr:PepSY domain-containing protein [Pueribacillus theae]PWA10345.1 hypothetical protein DCC39_11560 [Pueribacillus theae]